MSNSDNVVRLPRIASTHTLVVEVDDIGAYSYLVPDNMKRAVVRYDRQQKREMAQSGSGRKATLADLDAQEQMRDALLSPAYEGPVGTPKVTNNYRSNLDDTLRYAYECTDVCCQPEYAHEEKVAGLWRSFVRSERKVEPVVKVQPVVSRTQRMQQVLNSNVDRSRERDMREIGFGGRYGIHLEG